MNTNFFCLKNNLENLMKLRKIHSSLNKFQSVLNINEIIINFSESGESCAQNYCQINTQLIESFECFNKSIDNNKQFKCFWPKCGFITNIKNSLKKHFNIHSNKRQFVCNFIDCNESFK